MKIFFLSLCFSLCFLISCSQEQKTEQKEQKNKFHFNAVPGSALALTKSYYYFWLCQNENNKGKTLNNIFDFGRAKAEDIIVVCLIG